MQQLILEFTIIILISVVIGCVAAMTGISGGAFKTPLLIIFFSLSGEYAAAASLLSAAFVAVVSTIGYHRQKSGLIDFRIGSLAVIATVPGTYVGVTLRTIAAHAHILRFVFGILLFPIALKLLLSQSEDREHSNGQKRILSFSQLGRKKSVLSIVAIFLAGVLAGLLGIGGGTIIVPVLCIILEFPILMAAATSMFTMIFTSSVGSIINYFALAQTGGIDVFLYYGIAMGIGMIFGGIIGPRYASRVDSAWLQRLFGFLLIFPLVKMMRMGQLWLNPSGSSYFVSTIGDIIIWLVIGIPMWLHVAYRIKSKSKEPYQNNSTKLPSTEV